MLSTLYALIPFAFAIFGAVVASLYRPKPAHQSLLQHFVAGVVIGAVAIELLPKILERGHSLLSIAIGFVLGVLFMVALHELAHLLAANKHKARLPLRMIGACGIDLFTDGILIGLSIVAGAESSLLIAISLTPCAFFLNLTMGSMLKQKNLSPSVIYISSLFTALMLPIGALFGTNFVHLLPANALTGAISASIAALLYLGIEEFLVEAHKNKEDHYTPLSFFFGFLLVLLLTI